MLAQIKNDPAALVASLAHAARGAQATLSSAGPDRKKAALEEAANQIRQQRDLILAANMQDMNRARASRISKAMLDRLELTPGRIEGMADSVAMIAGLPDPVGQVLAEFDRPNGLKIRRISVPLGVIGIIYESRPNVTADAGALCLKSGNAAILRGGSDSTRSSDAILACLHAGLQAANLPEAAIQLVPSTDRAMVGEMLAATGLIDVIIPRGGKSLTERVMRDSRVPTLLHLDGNCHTYIHAEADLAMAETVLLNAKMRRTGVCGATEKLVIDRALLLHLPRLTEALLAKGCALKGDEAACAADPRLSPASEADWGTEYLDAVLAVKTVSGIDEAVAHINRYGSHHTDAIVTRDAAAAACFLQQVDSAIVMHNASTQFADGGEFGFGAEIGIATGRLHARGPVGAQQLTTYKYVVEGQGQVRPG